MKMTGLNTLRQVVLGAAVTLASIGIASAQDTAAVATALEGKHDARIGFVLRDMTSDWQISQRGDERFPMSSTFKPLLCAAVLARSDSGDEDMERHLTYQTSDLVSYSPVTELYVDTGMTLNALCEATITISDNTAANLLLETIDGPAGLTRFLRGIGDPVTRLDRWETTLNSAEPGNVQDTTTPTAILDTVETLLWGDVLSPTSVAQLRQWMIDDQVADALIRSHLPAGWRIGDKTGGGAHGTRGIIAFIEPDNGGRYLAAIYVTENDTDFPTRNAIIADIGAAMIAEIQAR